MKNELQALRAKIDVLDLLVLRDAVHVQKINANIGIAVSLDELYTVRSEFHRVELANMDRFAYVKELETLTGESSCICEFDV